MVVSVVQLINNKIASTFNWPSDWRQEYFGGNAPVEYRELTPTEVAQGVDNNWTFDQGNYYPPPDTTPTFGRIITKLAFRRRFVDTERRAIKKAALGLNNALTEGQWLDIASAMDDLLAAGYIHLDRTETVSFVQALEALGLIGSGRATEVLSPPVWSLELLAESRVMFDLPPVPTDIEMAANSGKGYSTVGQFKADHPEYA